MFEVFELYENAQLVFLTDNLTNFAKETAHKHIFASAKKQTVSLLW